MKKIISILGRSKNNILFILEISSILFVIGSFVFLYHSLYILSILCLILFAIDLSILNEM